MDSIDTIIANWTHLSSTPIDWSVNGGVPWFLGSLVFTVTGMVLVARIQASEARRRAVQELYREAEAQGHLRNARRDWRGYSEHPAWYTVLATNQGDRMFALILALLTREPEPVILTGPLEAVYVPAGWEGPIAAGPFSEPALEDTSR